MKKYFSLIKFSHTIFALPFALVGATLGFWSLATTGTSLDKPWWLSVLLVVLCMVFARSAAMAFNRYLDRDIDAENARTAIREIPSGLITPQNALAFALGNAALFVITTAFINFWCLILSPVALAVILGYSYTKRFTAWCHLVLGLGLALAPVGAYLAVTGVFALAPVVLGLVVLTWVSGFDIIYALQDEAFDRSHGLNSIPVRLGRLQAMQVSNGLHLGSAVGLLGFAWLAGAQAAMWLGVALFIGLLIYQHRIVKPDDLSRVNASFFTSNGIASLAFATLGIIDLSLRMA
jgi:4-hydroxybenzoate polyprenyltransferase